MKKILTLLFALGVIYSASAQTTRDEARRVILGQPKNTGNYPTGSDGRSYPTTYPYPGNYPNGGSREAQIDQVNRDYDAKIYSIRNNPNLTQQEKERVIRQLERDRQNQIRRINDQYNGNNGDYDDDRRYDRKDNGRHLGWEKGKGNPHRNGGKPGKGHKNKNKDWKDRDDD